MDHKITTEYDRTVKGQKTRIGIFQQKQKRTEGERDLPDRFQRDRTFPQQKYDIEYDGDDPGTDQNMIPVKVFFQHGEWQRSAQTAAVPDKVHDPENHGKIFPSE